MTAWTGKRVLILGAARQGLAAARWLAIHGAEVSLNDRRSPEALQAAVRSLEGLKVQWVLGDHPLALLDATDVLCISGGVPLDNPLVREAAARGIPLTNDTQIFMEVVPCPTVGITGSAGKTTTTTLVGLMAQQALGARAYTGGNIGDPLLNHVDGMNAQDLAILELSSFQLEQMTLAPRVAVILNITPNHLDRHGTMAAYTAAKRRILEFQAPADTAVLGRDDPGAWEQRQAVRGRLVSFGISPLPEGMDGTWLSDGTLHLHSRGADLALLPADSLQLRGEHNLLNVLAAFAIGDACGLEPDAMIRAARSFQGVAHRLEYVRTVRGARWYNDSIATAPERTMAAIRAFNEPIVLLLGGRDKNLPWHDLASLVRQRVAHVVLFGEAAGKIQAALAEQPGTYSLTHCPDLEQAVQAAAKVAGKGDVVLFSPGGTSFDSFKDFEERGEAYRKWVSELT